MTRTHTLVSTATLIVGLAMGCDRTPAEEQERAMEAQREANEQVGEARQAAAEDIRKAEEKAAAEKQEAVRDMNEAADMEAREVDRDREPVRGSDIQDEKSEEIAEAKKELAEDKAAAEAEADETIAEVKEEIVEERRALREYGEAELRDVDKALTEIGNEAVEADPQVQRRTENQLTQLRSERDALMAEVAQIDTKNAKQLTPFRKNLEKRFEKLDERIEALRESL
jgi:hypothetical protein